MVTLDVIFCGAAVKNYCITFDALRVLIIELGMKKLTYKYSLTCLAGLLLLGACGDNHSHEADNHNDDHAEKSHEATHNAETDHGEELAGADHSDEDHHEDDHDDGDHDDHDDEVRQLGSHVHGDASLSLALDGEVLVIELESPLYNLLGFEHAPENENQRKILEGAEIRLSEPNNLFSINGEAGCEGEVPEYSHLMYDHSNEHGNDHDDDHSEHKDALLEYSFTCTAPEKLRTLTVNLFDHFPEMGELETIYLGDGVQLQADLTANNKTMTLTK